jgi:dTDP-4-dehydrorhamnose 3,5-epimerase
MSERAMLPSGVELLALVTHRDHRGTFTEVFRESWSQGRELSRWDMLRAGAGMLRGVHLHLRCDSYWVLLQGRATVGLRDLRGDASAQRGTAMVELSGETMAALVLPRGIAHGLYFHEPSLFARAMTASEEPEPALGCAWDDPELGIPWPARQVRVSPGDAALPPLRALRQRLASLAGRGAA